MLDRREKAEAVAREYTRAGTLRKALGSGQEGFVYPTENATAIKIFTYREKFERELAAYRRLHKCDVYDVLGVAIPRPIRFSMRLLVIEMTMVQPPFLLDFAGSTLDDPIEFEQGVEEEWWDRVRQDFEGRFELARDVFYALQHRTGIYYYDLAPRNLNLDNYDPP
jgi:hypothetical protein